MVKGELYDLFKNKSLVFLLQSNMLRNNHKGIVKNCILNNFCLSRCIVFNNSVVFFSMCMFGVFVTVHHQPEGIGLERRIIFFGGSHIYHINVSSVRVEENLGKLRSDIENKRDMGSIRASRVYQFSKQNLSATEIGP